MPNIHVKGQTVQPWECWLSDGQTQPILLSPCFTKTTPDSEPGLIPGGICTAPDWARNGQTGLARSIPVWAPAGLAIWDEIHNEKLIDHIREMIHLHPLITDTGWYARLVMTILCPKFQEHRQNNVCARFKVLRSNGSACRTQTDR